MILVNDELIHNSRVGRHLRDLKHEISEMLEAETSSLKTIENLNDQLELYKRAYADANAENKKNEKIKIEVEKQRDDLESQLKGYRIITLIDGDGAIFSKDLLAQGQPGGDIAARRLSNAITSHLNEKYGVNQYQIWVYIFFNKCGLLNTLKRHGLDAQSSRFDDFMAGFNTAAERFLMVDVGNAKEAADAKIKVHLEDDIRLSQTYKIIFGGCHDNGYVTTLRSQITAGYKNKLILLRTYDDAATGVTDLKLPLMAVPDLFMPQKLGTGGGIPPALTNRSHSPTTPMFPPGLSPRGSTAASTWRPSIPPTYSSMTQTMSKQGGTSEFDYHGSNASNEQNDDVLPKPMSPRARHVNPDLPLSKQKPPPCTLFYLATCKHSIDCKYGHDYLLDSDHLDELRNNAKKAPCPAVNRDELCTWGENCCYGHTCPLTTRCHFFMLGRCKFVGADMHKEPRQGSERR